MSSSAKAGTGMSSTTKTPANSDQASAPMTTTSSGIGGAPKAFDEQGAVGKQFTEQGALGGTAQAIGGPFDKDGAIGKQFTTGGSIGGSVQSALGGDKGT